VEPRGPAEELLTSVWADVLGLERVGATDDFFALGGHSLLAVRVLARVRDLFGVELPVRRIFEEPTVSALAERIEAARREGMGAPPPIVRGERPEDLPLSHAQRRLWFLDRLDPDNPVYNMPLGLRLSGELAPAALGSALAELLRRHEVLRTRYAERGGEPIQSVAEPGPWNLPVVDLSALPEGARAEAARRLAREEASRPFDLSGGPVVRMALLRLESGLHDLVGAVHHIACDEWSLGVLVRDLEALYQGLPLPALPIHYADYALWQRSWLESREIERHLAWWTERLAGAPPLIALPADRPRPAWQDDRGAVHRFAVDEETVAALRALGRAEGATPFMVLLTAFQVLLARYSGQEDLCAGTPVAGRDRLETEGLVGLFVNTLVLRADLSGEPGFGAAVARTRSGVLEAFAHQELPFDLLVARLERGRDPGRSPLFLVLFSLQRPVLRQSFAGLAAAPLDFPAETAKLDLSLAFEEDGEAFHGAFEYRTALFDAGTVARMAGHLEILLREAVVDPRRRISEIELLTGPERRQLLVEIQGERVPRGLDRCVHELIAGQAARRPEAVAVTFGRERLTYGELAARAGGLAARLRALGVGPEVRVGLFCERSLEMIVGMLGILGAGGAYLPLDPSYPAERLRFMLEDAAAPVLVAQEALLPELPAFAGSVVRLREEEALSAGAPAVRIDPANAAYVIYTSGSTSRPKGVAVTHRSLVNYTGVAADIFDISPGDRVLQFASISFDASVEEIFPCLSRGATLVLRTEAMLGSVSGFLESCGENGITVADLPMSYWHEVAAAVEAEPSLLPGSLRLVILGSERALPRRVAGWRRTVGPRVRLVNTYGPTEATVVATMADLTGPLGEIAEGREVPIGRPVRNAEARVADRYLRAVPVGVPGELLLGGAGLARGYLGRPDLTAERFIPDPWSAEPGARLYRTGDRVLFRPDGELEFLGRLDHQVKVRGFRIELGEIETALLARPGVRDAVVVAREDIPGDRRLVAYVVGEATAPELKRALGERLPEYMVPSSFVFLESLPQTPNGKVDRKALPAPERREEGYAAPRTPVEELLAGIWSEVLGLERVGREDHFFERGGHSLLAVQVVSRVREVFGVELPVRRLFEAPTLGALAECIVAERGSGVVQPPLERLPRGETVPLSFAQERLWFLDQLEPGGAAYNIPGALRLEGELDEEALERALAEIVCRHEALRTVFRQIEGRPAGVLLDRAPALARIDLSSESEALLLAREDAGRPFDLAAGPLARFSLLRLLEREHVLLVNLHHIAADGWSLGVWSRELSALYEAFAKGEPSPLPELPVQYADYAAWQREWLQGEVLEGQLSWWRERLGDLEEGLELPADRPRPAAPSYRGGAERVELDRETVSRLEELGRSQGSTLFMTLLACFEALLLRWSGQERFAVGTPVAGRTRVETEGLIGLFVNTLAMPSEVGGDPRFTELLERVREMALGAYAHQDLPFEKLVEALSPERALSRAPLFQVMFVLQNAPMPELSVSGLRLSGLEVESGSAKFDLTLTLSPSPTGLSGGLEYSRDLFDRTTVARLAASWSQLVTAVASDPDRRLSELPLLGEAQRHQLLVEWNAPVLSGEPRCLHELFAAQALRRPEAEAVRFEGRSLSYGELEARANRLARRLRRLGVGPEERVGICLERTPELLIALLAVLKAGGAYVPLDPRYPQARLELMLEDSGARVVIGEELALEHLPAWSGERVLVDRERESLAAESAEAPASGVTARNLAYLIYTSGSTGRPKGVAIEHASAWALAAWAREAFPPETFDAVLASTSVCFDLSVFEIFVPLAWGGRLVLAADALELPRLAGAGVRLVNTVPSAMTELVRLGAVPSSVRVVSLAGEPLKRTLADALYALGIEHVYNLYGPSEDTTYSTGARIPAGDSKAPAIGRPLPGTQAYVVDGELKPVPLGASGELLLGGAGLARGYLGRPELTAERFIPDPWSAIAGGRLYRTGDRARYRPEGELDFLGRLDHQVKVRGFRIELGEIETALLGRPGVRDAVVVAREDVPGDRRLVAYVVGEVPVPELRRALGERLPEYMVPSTFVFLEALPQTPNGKVDRKALPKPEGHGRESGHVEPRTPVEKELAAIWCAVLGAEKVGLNDNFFELGGHSLLATQVMARVRESFGVAEIPLRSLFQKPTLGELALAVTQAEAEEQNEDEMRRMIEELRNLSGDDLAELLQESES
jgi:amino acid adenylation domain-containing protein